MSNRNRTSGGFTLLEVLVALAILTIVVTGLVAAVVQRGKTQRYLEEKSAAELLVANLAAEYRLSGQPQEPEVEEGDAQMGGFALHWRRTLVLDETTGLREVEIQAASDPQYPLYAVSWRF